MRDAVLVLMSRLCQITGHVGGCGLLNHEFVLLYDERRDDFRLTVANPFYRLWRWGLNV